MIDWPVSHNRLEKSAQNSATSVYYFFKLCTFKGSISFSVGLDLSLSQDRQMRDLKATRSPNVLINQGAIVKRLTMNV